MILEISLLVVALVIILLSSELFTNGIEWLGQRLQLSEGVVGSILAAVGTALPETLVPIVAVVCFGERHGNEVSIGAIAGAPFMLSTLTFGICGFAIWYFSKKGRRQRELVINHQVLSRDLRFFIMAFSVGMLCNWASDFKAYYLPYIMAVVLLGIYCLYLYRTFSHEGEVGQEPEKLYFDRLLKKGSNKLRFIVPQVVLGVGGIVGGAYIFVENLQDVAEAIGFPPLVLSLIICPIATELPEKVNSVLWIKSGKDTLALGNITGALVFQSCIPVAFGVAFTTWDLDAGTLLTCCTAVFSATVVLILMTKRMLKFWHLMFGALLYVMAVSTLLALDVADHLFNKLLI